MRTKHLGTAYRLVILPVLLVAIGRPTAAQPGSYSFTVLSKLGQAAPGGGFHINDYEPGALNNRGDAIFGTDLGTSSNPATFFGEGVFLKRAGATELELARGTGPAPGGGVFDFLLLGQTALNDEGDAAFAFTLQPLGLPIGVNSGVYRSTRTGTTTAAVIPFVTPAPGGGVFQGVSFNVGLNNRGDLVFTGIISTDKGIHVPGEAYIGLGEGWFKADTKGAISSLVSPGDAAPGGGTFDVAGFGWINQSGDTAFIGHVAGEASLCLVPPNPPLAPQAQFISASTSLYFRDANKGTITSIAHQGDAAPRGGIFKSATSPVMNDSGQIVFLADVSPFPNCSQTLGVYLHSGNSTIAIAREGDTMPGGGKFQTASLIAAENVHINNGGDVVFNALLDTGDTGLYLWSHGSLTLIARTGTVIPNVGTVSILAGSLISFPPPPFTVPNSGAINNDRGQVMFSATLTDGNNVLLLATPHP